MNNNRYNIIIALLGVVLGVLITLIGLKITDGNRKFDGDYNRWRKLNLILQEVQKLREERLRQSLSFQKAASP